MAVLVALAASHAGPAVAQPGPAKPAADPLPSVIYPFPVPATGQRDHSVPGVVPEPVPVAVERPPVQYVLTDGVWGYRDLDRHFHPKPAAPMPAEPMNGPETDPIKAAAVPREVPTETTPVTTPGFSVRRYAASLPNPPVRAIVVTPSSARERSPVR